MSAMLEAEQGQEGKRMATGRPGGINSDAGQPTEAIRSDFPTLSLEQVYGALTFYLGHKDEVDNDMAARERVEDAFSEAHPAPSHLKEKLERAQRRLPAQRR